MDALEKDTSELESRIDEINAALNDLFLLKTSRHSLRGAQVLGFQLVVIIMPVEDFMLQ